MTTLNLENAKALAGDDAIPRAMLSQTLTLAIEEIEKGRALRQTLRDELDQRGQELEQSHKRELALTAKVDALMIFASGVMISAFSFCEMVKKGEFAVSSGGKPLARRVEEAVAKTTRLLATEMVSRVEETVFGAWDVAASRNFEATQKARDEVLAFAPKFRSIFQSLVDNQDEECGCPSCAAARKKREGR